MSSESESRGLSPDPDRKHLLDPSFYLRRRRYDTSHGVGLLELVLSGLEGTLGDVVNAYRIAVVGHRMGVRLALAQAD